MVNQDDPPTKAARTVLIDLLDLLREYGGSIVVAGGWVPALLPSKGITSHVGTTDVDLVLDYRRIPERGNGSALNETLMSTSTIFWRNSASDNQTRAARKKSLDTRIISEVCASQTHPPEG